MENDGENTLARLTKEVTRVWRAWTTVHEMLQDRGYELAEAEVKVSLDRFSELYIHNERVDYSRLQFSARPSEAMIKKFTPPPTATNANPEPECGTIFVEFCSAQTKVGVTLLQKFIRHCADNQYRSGIFVTTIPISPQTRKLIAATKSLLLVECFLEEELVVNITRHELVPQHVPLNKEEKMALLRRYGLQETQLPRILGKDPVARYFALQRGQVVKIIRTSVTAGRYACYRLCV